MLGFRFLSSFIVVYRVCRDPLQTKTNNIYHSYVQCYMAAAEQKQTLGSTYSEVVVGYVRLRPRHRPADASVPTTPPPLGRRQRSLSIEDCHNAHMLRRSLFALDFVST